MKYFFPSFIPSVNVKQKVLGELEYTVNSGTNALRLLLRSFKLPFNSKVAIPVFVCSSVRQAVEREKFIPVLFDLKSDNTFWTQYDFKRIIEEKIQVVILAHLYGFIHPDTKIIANFCFENNIKLIHDAAQSFGIDEQILKGSSIVYSFGPGKSTTAAGGGWIKNIDKSNYLNIVKKFPVMSFQNMKAKHFLKTRIYNYKITKFEQLINSIIRRISTITSDIADMSSFQKKAASYAISNINEIWELRKKRFDILVGAINNNENMSLAYDDGNGSYFKVVVFLKQTPTRFKNYLTKNEIPYFSLFENNVPNVENKDYLPNFMKNAFNFIEISAEASIPEEEIIEIARVFNNFNGFFE